MTAVGKGSRCDAMRFTQGEAAGAQSVCLFHLCLTADQADATGLVPVVTISKAGAAFAAAAGVVAELTNGWYKITFTAVDLSTLGALGMRVAVALADTLEVVHQVIALDENTATVNPGAGGIVAASFDAGAAAMLQTSLVTRTTPKTIAGATGDPSVSMVDAVDTVITATGTWGGGSLQPQVCEDPTATVPVWTNSGAALAADGSKTIVGPHNAVRAHFTGGTAAALAVTFAQRKPVALA